MSKFRFDLIIVALSFVFSSYSQSVTDTIKKLAIECKDLTSPNERVYSVLKDYQFICLGEMHGTKEPAQFLTGLAKTFVSHGRKVTIGFEILESQMDDFRKNPNESTLTKTAFFRNENGSGMNSEAWQTAINECNKLGVAFCFFDGISDEAMYERLFACYKNDTNTVFLTLSGNVHNKQVLYKNTKTMGSFLAEKFGKHVFSINHIYNEGTMYNRTSEGLKVRSVAPQNNAFATSTTFDNYFITNIFSDTDGYSAYLYTRTVTASFHKKK